MSDFYDREGKPLTLMKWAALMEDHEYRQVALDHAGVYAVSTVWLGLDHNHSRIGRPLIFESAVVNHGMRHEVRIGERTWMASDIEVVGRYATEEEALEGHRQMLRRVSSAVMS